MFRMAKEYNTRPSDLLGLENEYVAFCVDQVVFRWGSFVQGELDSVEGKDQNQIQGRRELVARRLLEGGSRFVTPTPTR